MVYIAKLLDISLINLTDKEVDKTFAGGQANLSTLSRHAELEMMAVLSGVKPAQRLEVKVSTKKKVAKIFQKNQLLFRERPYQFIFKDGFLIDDHDKMDEPSQVFFVAKSEKRLDLLERSDNYKVDEKKRILNNYRQGLLLGFPKCCIRFFSGNANVKSGQLLLDLINGQKNQCHPLLNIIDHEKALLSHIPCSLDCEESVFYAESLLKRFNYTSDKFLKGNFLYFKDGSYIKLDLQTYDKFSTYKILKISEGAFGGSFLEHSKKKLLFELEKGNWLQIGDSLKIYKDDELLLSFGGKGVHWAYVSF